jgi:hypothetical protein
MFFALIMSIFFCIILFVYTILEIIWLRRAKQYLRYYKIGLQNHYKNIYK